jgi:hypothetical protein
MSGKFIGPGGKSQRRGLVVAVGLLATFVAGAKVLNFIEHVRDAADRSQ